MWQRSFISKWDYCPNKKQVKLLTRNLFIEQIDQRKDNGRPYRR